jgi:hypothetical protein
VSRPEHSQDAVRLEDVSCMLESHSERGQATRAVKSEPNISGVGLPNSADIKQRA